MKFPLNCRFPVSAYKGANVNRVGPGLYRVELTLALKRISGAHDSDRQVTSAFGKYMSYSMLLPVATCVGYAMGYGIDQLLGLGWMRFVFLGLGAIGGFMSLVRGLAPPVATVPPAEVESLDPKTVKHTL